MLIGLQIKLMAQLFTFPMNIFSCLEKKTQLLALLLHCCSHPEPGSHTVPVAVDCVVFTNVGSSSVIRTGKPHQTRLTTQIHVFLVRQKDETSENKLNIPMFLLIRSGLSQSYEYGISNPRILAIECFMCNKNTTKHYATSCVGKQGLAAYQYSCLVCSQCMHHWENI